MSAGSGWDAKLDRKEPLSTCGSDAKVPCVLCMPESSSAPAPYIRKLDIALRVMLLLSTLNLTQPFVWNLAISPFLQRHHQYLAGGKKTYPQEGQRCALLSAQNLLMLPDQLPWPQSGFWPGLQAVQARPSDHQCALPDPGPVCWIWSPLMSYRCASSH